MKRSRSQLSMFGKFSGLVEKIGKANFCDRAIAIMKRFIENEAVYQDCMAAFFIQHHPEGRQSIQLLYSEACALRRQVENLKLSLAEETDVIMQDHTVSVINDLERRIAENLREYSKFSVLLGNQYCVNPGNVAADIKQKVDNQIQRIPIRQPISDSELLHAYYHYAGATSNRTVGGTLATGIVTYFIDHAPISNYEIPLKLAEVYIMLNRMAANREKILRPKDTTVDMDEARVIFSELDAKVPNDENSKTRAKLIEMQRNFKGGPMPEELRAMSLEMYLVDFNQELDKNLLVLQKILSDTLLRHPECDEEIGMMSAYLRSIFEDVEAERQTISQFSRKNFT